MPSKLWKIHWPVKVPVLKSSLSKQTRQYYHYWWQHNLVTMMKVRKKILLKVGVNKPLQCAICQLSRSELTDCMWNWMVSRGFNFCQIKKISLTYQSNFFENGVFKTNPLLMTAESWHNVENSWNFSAEMSRQHDSCVI